ncbi:MAG: twin-arginine translocase subunit TatC [Acidimicrobiia bacterium]
MKLRKGKTSDKTDTRQLSSDGHMTLIEHLNELRSRLLKCVLAVVAGLIFAFIVYNPVLDFLRGPYRDLCEAKASLKCDGNLLNPDPIGGFGTRVRLSGYMGIGLALPVLMWQVWRFIAPGLLAKEKKYAIPFIMSSMVLFASGALVAWLTLPKALEWLTAYAGSGTNPQFFIDKYVGFVLLLMIGFGAGFQFPVILVTLELLGVVTPQTLLKSWRTVVVVIVIVAAVATPGGDPFSMLGLGVPLVLFYFIAVGIGFLFKRKKPVES